MCDASVIRDQLTEIEAVDEIRQILLTLPESIRANKGIRSGIFLPLRLRDFNVTFFDALFHKLCDDVIDDASMVPDPKNDPVVYYASLVDFISCQFFNTELSHLDAELLAQHDAGAILSLVKLLVCLSRCLSDDDDKEGLRPAETHPGQPSSSSDCAPQHMRHKLRRLGKTSVILNRRPTSQHQHRGLLKPGTVRVKPKGRMEENESTKENVQDAPGPSLLAVATHHLRMTQHIRTARKDAGDLAPPEPSLDVSCARVNGERLGRVLSNRRSEWELRRAKLAVANAKKNAVSTSVIQQRHRNSMARISASTNLQKILKEKQQVEKANELWWRAAANAERMVASRLRQASAQRPITVMQRIRQLQEDSH